MIQIRKMPIKTKWDSTTHLLERTKCQETDNTKRYRRYGAPGNHWHIAAESAKQLSHWEESLEDAYKTKLLSCDTSMVLLVCIYTYKILYIDFIIALLITAKTRKQTRCTLIGKWINKNLYSQMLEFYSKPKRNELLRHRNTWRKLKDISLSESHQSLKSHTFYDS